MCRKWVCFVMLVLIIVTYSIPGRFHHDYHSGHNQPTWGQDWHGWGHDWYSGHTTQRAKVTTAAPSRFESKSSTIPPQPTITDVEIRLGEVITTADAPISQSTQAEQDLKRLLDAATVKPEGSSLDVKPDGKTSLWQVAVYHRREYKCGGSLVKEYIVVSSDNCFQSTNKYLSLLNMFRVAAGKIYPGYDDPRDTGAQYSDIEECITNMGFAVVTLTTPVKYTDAVKPLCVNLFWEDEQQPKKGNFGTVASWAEYEDGECLPKPSESLHWLYLPFVEQDVCQVQTSSNTSGSYRICAGELDNTTQFATDSGNGLVFYQDKVPYLIGITTDTYKDQDRCTEFNTRSFSDIIRGANHLERIFNHINDSLNLEQCEDLYNTNNTTEAKVTVTGDGFSPYGGSFSGNKPGVRVLEGTKSAPAYQWHVGIYNKARVPFMQICGGTLVKRDFVISAAHCFWDDTAGQQPASQYAVAAGKLYRPWNNTHDTYAQHSDVSRIILHARFRGSAMNFQDDIAILRLSSPFTYGPGVQPACLSFNATFERMQLQPKWLGTVLGWGLTDENGRPSQRLNYLYLPYADIEDCFTDSEPALLQFITSDKICAGNTYTSHALCRGDSGGGFVIESGAIDVYLHGVMSTAAGNKNLCNVFTLVVITSTYAHRGFIRENIPDIEKECADAARKESNAGGTGNVETGNIGAGNVGTENMETGNGSIDNVGTGNVETGNLVSTGENQGLNMIEGTLGNAVTATPVFSQLPYYPNHFVCNCNCKT